MVGISVLGPLSVDGGASLGRRDRIVLGALALRPGDVLTADQLADALWGDEPPASSAKVVQGCVMRLRKALGPQAVETTPHGYRLVVPADDVDARRFERLVGRGRELVTLGEPERAAYVLGEALALWRGRALVDVENWEPGRIEANRLEEVRLDAEEVRLDAALRAGQVRTVMAEAQALVAAAPVRERRWGLLALAQYQAGRQAEALRTLHRARRSLGEELGLDPGPDLVSLEQAILQQDPSLLVEGAEPEPSATCPYLGLVPYDVGDADAYFGRDADVAACLQRLTATGVLAVVGPSGSGKSSLVRAGVAAALRRDGRKVAVVTPGARPLDALTARGSAAAAPVLVVDQCEEAVILSDDPDEQARFFAALAAHADQGPLVVALRADRMGDVSADPAFARLVERGLYLLGPMGDDDLRAAVEGPARQAGLVLEPGLVDLLLREVEGEPGALPLLSHALRQTWTQREGRTLTVAGYQATGGIRRAVAQSAEEVYDRVDPEQQDALRTMLLRLVTPTPDGEPVRCRVPRRSVATDPAHERLIELLVGARLVTSDDGVVELAHEALARAWPRLRGWLDDDVEGQRVLRHMTVAADAWDSMGRPDSELYRGARLDAALEWRDAARPDLTQLERAFLDASAAQAASERQALAERAHRDARQNRRLRVQRVALAVALVVALVVGAVAVGQRQQTEEERQVASARELAAAANANLDVDPQRSILLALEAVERGQTGGDAALPEAEEALHNAVTRSRVVLRVPGVGGSLDWSPTGDVFVTEGPENTGVVDIRDARTGESVRAYTGHGTDVNDVVFNHDGTMLATTGDDGAARIWDPATGEEQLAVEPPGSGDAFDDVYGPSFSPDGRLFAATWYLEGVVRVVDLPSGRTVQEIRSIVDPRTTSFDPTGTRLAVSSLAEPKVAVFDVPSGQELFTLPGLAGPAIDADWSPDGASIATTGTSDDVAQIFDAATGRHRFSLVGDASGLLELDWSPDGTRLVTGSQDGSVALWLLTGTSGRLLAMAPGPTRGLTLSSRDTRGGVNGLAFSPDGTRLMAGNFGVSATTVWDVSIGGDAEVANLPARAYDFGAVAYTPDGRRLVATSDAGSLAVWDAHDLTFERALRPEGSSAAAAPADEEEPSRDRAVGEGLAPTSGPVIGPVDVHPDGQLVAAALESLQDGSSQSFVRAWDVVSGRQVFEAPLGAVMVFDAAWSPTGDVLAVSAGDDASQAQVTILDRAGREVEARQEEPGVYVDSLAFTEDGERLVMARDTYYGNPDLPRGEVVAWSWRSGGPPRRLHDARMIGIELDPAGALVAGLSITREGSQDAGLWDATSGRRVARLTGHTANVSSMAFSPDGSRLATSSADGTVRVWDTDTGEKLVTLPGHVGGVGSVAFSPDGSQLASVGVEGLVRIWTLDLDELVDIAERKLIRDLTPAECRQYLHVDCP